MSYKHELLKRCRFEIDVTTMSPLSIKDNNEAIRRDPITKKFVLPGSSIAGAFRNYYEKYISERDTNLLFANELGDMNNLYFYDSIQINSNTEISSRPGLMIDSHTLTGQSFEDNKKSGSKFSRDFIPEGTQFMMVFELFQYDERMDYSRAKTQFLSLLRAFINNEIPLGGHKKIGFGLFEIMDIREQFTDFTDFGMLKDYLNEKVKTISIKEELLNASHSNNKIRFVIEAVTQTPILIKDEVLREQKEPDHINLVNAYGNFVIPGSSLKGVLRNRMSRILNSFYLDDRDILTDLFGKAADHSSEGYSSTLTCFDTIIKDAKTQVYNKIKIDHFTGGVMQGNLMNEEVVMGNVKLQVVLDKGVNTLLDPSMKTGKEIGLLLLALKELCDGELSIGSGFAVGRGFFKGTKLTLHADKSYEYDFENPDKEVEKVFNDYIQRLTKEAV